MKLNFLARSSLTAGLKFTRMKNPTFSYALSGKEEASEDDMEQGKYEDPHFAFPIETSFDRVAITKAGDEPPPLGSAIYEDPKALKKRKSGKRIVFNTEDTYTFCIWTAYVDFAEWKIMNLPAIKGFSMSNLNGRQPMSVKVYSLTTDNDKHYQSAMETLLDIEVSHTEVTSIGSGAKKWLKENTLISINTAELVKEVKRQISNQTSETSHEHKTGKEKIDEKKSKKIFCCCFR